MIQITRYRPDGVMEKITKDGPTVIGRWIESPQKTSKTGGFWQMSKEGMVKK